MLLTTLVLHLLLGRYMVAAEVGARAATKGSMANGGRDLVRISASGSFGTVSVGRRYLEPTRRRRGSCMFWYRLRENSSDLGHFILAP